MILDTFSINDEQWLRIKMISKINRWTRRQFFAHRMYIKKTGYIFDASGLNTFDKPFSKIMFGNLVFEDGDAHHHHRLLVHLHEKINKQKKPLKLLSLFYIIFLTLNFTHRIGIHFSSCFSSIWRFELFYQLKILIILYNSIELLINSKLILSDSN